MNKKIKLLFSVMLVVISACSSLPKEEGIEKSYTSCYIKEDLPELNYKKSSVSKVKEVVNDTDTNFLDSVSGCSEREYLKFYKDKTITGNGSSSSYWRWEVTFSHEELENMLNRNLYKLKQERNSSVYKLKGDIWSLESIGYNPVGELKSIKVIKRGPSGIATDFMIKGSEGTYIVVRENSIRKLFNFSKESRDSQEDIYLIGKSGKRISKNVTMFPSAFFAVEKNENGYTFYGGGFGHGVGMPQWSAIDLAKNKGYDYKEILGRYYPDSELGKATSVEGFNGKLKVGITTNSQPEHYKIDLSSIGSMLIRADKFKEKIPKNTIVNFTRVGNKIELTLNNKKIALLNGTIEITSDEMIQVNSIRRSLRKNRAPSYRGYFEIRSHGQSSLILVNIVDIEDYLKQVIASEMPVSFGLEPLKAQAVTARTYAVKEFFNNKFKKYGFDLDDTINTQVYNNLDENEIINEAIEETKGKILKNGDKPSATFFYSTSGGYSSSSEESW